MEERGRERFKHKHADMHMRKCIHTHISTASYKCIHTHTYNKQTCTHTASLLLCTVYPP